MYEFTCLAGRHPIDDLLDSVRRRAEHFAPIDREIVLDIINGGRE